MSERGLLGPADVDDHELARMVADLLGHDPGEVRLLRSTAEEFPYDLPAITTAAVAGSTALLAPRRATNPSGSS